MSKEVIRRVVLDHKAALRACYERGLLREPKLQGTNRVRAVIGERGRVQSVMKRASNLDDGDVDDCVMAVFQKMEFPPRKGGIVVVEYPVAFRPGAK